jgi:hypothetical protein
VNEVSEADDGVEERGAWQDEQEEEEGTGISMNATPASLSRDEISHTNNLDYDSDVEDGSTYFSARRFFMPGCPLGSVKSAEHAQKSAGLFIVAMAEVASEFAALAATMHSNSNIFRSSCLCPNSCRRK